MATSINHVPSKWVTLGIVGIGNYLTASELGVVVTFPTLIEAFDSSPSVIIWVQLVYMLVSASIIFTTGNLADRFGLGRVFTLGFLVFTAGLALSSLAQGSGQLIACRGFQAVGHAMLLSSEAALIMRAFPATEQGKALGLRSAAGGLGLSSGPLLAGILVQTLGWQSIFYSRIPLALLGFFLSWRFLRLSTPAQDPQGHLDIFGAVALFGSISAFLLAVNQAGRVGWNSPVVMVAALTTLSLFPLLILIEKRAPRPVLDLALFKNNRFLLGQAALIFSFLAQGSVMYLTPFYFSGALGMTSFGIGLLLATFSVIRLLVSPISGLLTDAIGGRTPVTIGLLIMASGILVLSRQGGDGSLPFVVLGMVMTGFGSALFEPPNTRHIIESLPRQQWGTASASVAAGRQVSASTGTALIGTLFQIREDSHRTALTSQGLAPNQVDQRAIGLGFTDSLLLAMAFAFMGALIGALRPSHRPDDTNRPDV